MINSPWLLISQILFWSFVLYAGLVTPWRNLNDRVTQIWPALCAGLLLLWQLKATLSLGISIHLLGATISLDSCDADELMHCYQIAIDFGVPTAQRALAMYRAKSISPDEN